MYKHKYYRSLIIIAVVGMGIYYVNNNPLQSLSYIVTTDEPVTATSDKIEHEVLPIPGNFDALIAQIDKEIISPQFPDEQALLADEPYYYDEQLMPTIKRSHSATINPNINLLTGSDLWVYKPHLKEKVELDQQLFLPNDATIMQVDGTLLNQLALGDSLTLALPNNGTQQIIIASIKRGKNNVIVWGLQNSQRQDIGKITQIKEITEGSFITDDKQEYHLRTVKNKGWIANKDQLIDNNNQSVTKNKQPFSERFLNKEK